MDLTQELGKEIVEASITEDNQLLGMWRDLERKAYITIATAGIFLAATFASIRSLEGTTNFEKFLLTITIFLLLLAVFTAARVLRVKEIAKVPPGFCTTEWAHKFRSSPDTDSEKLWDYYTNRAAQWQHVNKSIDAKYEEKHTDLQTAQTLLPGALFAVCLNVVFRIF